MAQKICIAKRDDGEPCRAGVYRGGEFCFWHDPELKAEREAARKLGGERQLPRNEGKLGKWKKFKTRL